MYKIKYLKYKMKYLNLIKQKGGECDIPPSAEIGDVNEKGEDIVRIVLSTLPPDQRVTIDYKCFDVTLLFKLVILKKKGIRFTQPGIIPILNREATPEEKKIISNAFLQFMKFKPCRYFTMDGSDMLAIQLNNNNIIPINGLYRSFKRPENFLDLPYKTVIEEPGALIIINGLTNPESIYLNGSLGISLGETDGNNLRLDILLLYPDEVKTAFTQKHSKLKASIVKKNCTLLTIQ
jgi:hypothetical protein